MRKTTCPLGDDCDLNIAWMAGRESAKDELDQVCAKWAEVSQSNYQRAKAAEANLAKAQGALHQIAGKKDYADDPWGIARTTLAELKGQDDD